MSSAELQFTPLVLELCLIQSHLFWGELSAFSAANAVHKISNFCSNRYPSLLGRQRRYGMSGFAQHFYMVKGAVIALVSVAVQDFTATPWY